MIQRTLMLFGAWLLAAGTASAGGAYLPRSGTAESTSQRAILVLEGNTTTLILQSGFSGTATELAWVVPVAGIGAAQSVDLLRNVDVFERLHQETAPQVVRVVEKRKSFGCSSEGVTFVTPANIQPFAGLSATDASFFPLDGPLSADVETWLAGGDVGSVCPDLATSCTVDEDCGQPTVCQDGFCSNQVETCGNDAECFGETECFEQICVNLAPTGCSNDSQCGGEAACRAGHCLYLTPTCTDDTDCGGRIEFVDMCLGACSDAGSACTTGAECPKGETCEFTCVAGTENSGDSCSGDGDCGVTQCESSTCGDGSSCADDRDCGGVIECRSNECFFDTNDPKRPCAVDEDCAGLIECVDEYCAHNGHPCLSADDCGGITECTAHCTNRRVSCNDDADCDMICDTNACRDADTVPLAERRITEAYCNSPRDCAAANECETINVNGGDLALCTNLAPSCSSDATCNTTCQDDPTRGSSFCGGWRSDIACTNDSPCSAITECQLGICQNLTPTCTTDSNCGTTCELPTEGSYDLGLLCESDDDCASGRCVSYEGKRACTRACDAGNPCPTQTAEVPRGFNCVRAGDEDICWAREGAVEPGRCGGSDFRCSIGGQCTAATECSDSRTPGSAYPLSGDQSDWLTENADAGAKFTVTKLRGVAPATGAELLPPLAIQLGGDVPVFPLKSVDGSTLELELYIIGHERYRPSNFSADEVLIEQFFEGGDFDAWYAERLDDNFGATSAPDFLVEFADAIDLDLVDYVLGRPASVAQLGADQWFLTKLRARMSAPDRDLALEKDGDGRFVIRAVGNGTASEAALGWLGLVFAFGWGAWRVRQRR